MHLRKPGLVVATHFERNPLVLLRDWIEDARRRTLELIADLSADQLVIPQLPTVNPILWEVGHVAWFQEKWVLRHVFHRWPLHDRVDELYDSSAVSHDSRWSLPLPPREDMLSYVDAVRNAVVECLETCSPDSMRQAVYFALLTVFHEDMHAEALTYTRQTLAFSAPRLRPSVMLPPEGGPVGGDVHIPGGVFSLGASNDGSFVFDNEKWAHDIRLVPFSIARAPVTQGEFAGFIEDGGYRRQELWTAEGWQWRDETGAARPVYWKQGANGWMRRHFDEWVGLEPHLPVIHVNWHEANAYCRWAGRRLPTEAEWELAASGSLDAPRKRPFPWGVAPPQANTANLDWGHMGCLAVGALPEGDSAFGCRQMIGNVWEWTASDFLPYPGFVPDPYEEYSQPWFGTRKVLRGGCWATPGRLLRNTWRNFFEPHRRDIFAGFRTCAHRLTRDCP